MQRVNITIPEKMKADADYLVKSGLYGTFSDMVRIGLRELLHNHENVETLKKQIADWQTADETLMEQYHRQHPPLENWEQGDPQE